VAFVMCPKLLLPSVTPATVPLPVPKKNCGVFVTPNASRRNSRAKALCESDVLRERSIHVEKGRPAEKVPPHVAEGEGLREWYELRAGGCQ
jgi:hypothetical protein